jgi:putative ABC transport system permease protein
VIAKSLDRNSFEMLLLSLFAGIALLLASIGIYGLMSYSVEQRTQEIGIRMALGARQQDMLQLIVWQGLKLAVIGVGLGLAASYGLTRVLGSMLFGVKASDPLTFGGVALALLGVAALAAYIPARHAAAVEPSLALRQQ